jgi:hypothetical protein
MDGDGWGIDLVQALAVPLAVVAVLVLFHGPVGEFIRTLGSRVSKVGVGAFHLELTVAREVEVPWTLEGNLDFRSNTSAEVFDSYADSLRQNLEGPRDLDYVVVDLGNGKAWLTTRLFLFAILLQQQRGLRAMVFLDSQSDSGPDFLGLARPDAIRRRLTAQHPYMGKAFARATVDSYFMNDPQPYTSDGRLHTEFATNVAEQFLHQVQIQGTIGQLPTDIALPTGEDPSDWIPLDPSPGFPPAKERASWLTAAQVRGEWHTTLSHAHVEERTIEDIDRQQQIGAILGCENSEFVAVLSDGRFTRLADRQRLLEHLAIDVTRSTKSG